MTPRPRQSRIRGSAKRRSPARRGDAKAKTAGSGMRSLVGRNYADRVTRINPRALLPWFGLVLVLALGLAALRIDLIRIRYGVAELLAEEERLLEEGRELVVLQRKLRDPARLAVRAKELGFVRPEAVVTLADVADVDHGRDGEEEVDATERSARSALPGEPVRTAAAARVRGERVTR